MPPTNSFLLFRLWGPMASWGEIAVGERRGSWNRPSRSAILGLIAAALGIDRMDGAAHERIEAQIALAIRVDAPGKPLRDYHTTQSPSQRRGACWRTRRDELDRINSLNTILSDRRYYAETDAIIALWPRIAEPAYSLDYLMQKLNEPVFPLYLGRKACPLGRPPYPCIIDVDSLWAAFSNYDEQLAPLSDRCDALRSAKSAPELWLSEEDARALGLSPIERVTRRDGIRDRRHWLFNDRAEVRIGETKG